MAHDIDTIPKVLMIIQISIASCIMPLSTAYIYNISDLMKLLYVMSGLLLLTNIDNLMVELLKLQMEKNHSHIFKHGAYLQFNTCQHDIDAAYWWVMFMSIHSQANIFGTYLYNKLENCPTVDAYIQNLEAGNQEQFYSTMAAKIAYYVLLVSVILQIIWITFSFLTIPFCLRFVSKIESK